MYFREFKIYDIFQLPGSSIIDRFIAAFKYLI